MGRLLESHVSNAGRRHYELQPLSLLLGAANMPLLREMSHAVNGRRLRLRCRRGCGASPLFAIYTSVVTDEFCNGNISQKCHICP